MGKVFLAENKHSPSRDSEVGECQGYPVRVEPLSPEHWESAEGVMGSNFGQVKASKEAGDLGSDDINNGKLLEILKVVLVHVYLLKLKEFFYLRRNLVKPQITISKQKSHSVL